MWRSLRAFGVEHSAAEDAAQQVFLIASKKLDSIEAGSERAFLFGTARGVAANLRRSQRRNREHWNEEALESAHDFGRNPEEALAARQGLRHLERILEAMPDELRAVFVLFELEGVPTIEIADIIGIPAGTVASRLRRAREEFKTLVTRLKSSHE